METHQIGPESTAGGVQPQICGGQNVAGGEGLAETMKEGRPLAGNERTFHAKALRHVCGKFEEINAWGVEFVAALSAYLILSGRENIGVRAEDVIEWSGARARWKKRMREGMREAVTGEFVDEIKVPSLGDGRPGTFYDITEKGRRMLEIYNRRFEEVRNDAEARRMVAVLNGEAKRLRALARRRRGEEMRAAGLL